MTAVRRWVNYRRASCSSCSIAAITGNAPMSSPKAASPSCGARGWKRFAPRSSALDPKLADRVQAIASWDDVKLLTVTVDRLQRWYRQGLLCIGDAAHAMSPIGGVGINLAIQDAVAAANILWLPLRARTVSEDMLRKVQERREFPTRTTQRLQLFIQDRVVSNVLARTTRPSAALRRQAARLAAGASPHPGAAAWARLQA